MARAPALEMTFCSRSMAWADASVTNVKAMIAVSGMRPDLTRMISSSLSNALSNHSAGHLAVYAKIQAPYPTTRSRELAVSPQLHNESPKGSGTLVARVTREFAEAGVKFDQQAVFKLIRKELQELRRMQFLSDIGRETADKAERLFGFI